jgi:hypothetical protein
MFPYAGIVKRRDTPKMSAQILRRITNQMIYIGRNENMFVSRKEMRKEDLEMLIIFNIQSNCTLHILNLKLTHLKFVQNE